MNLTEYKKLLERSKSFQLLDAATKMKILSATGSDMDKYIAIFTQEKDLLVQAVTDYTKKADQVVVDFQGTVRAEERTKLQNVENQDQSAAEEQLANLISKL